MRRRRNREPRYADRAARWRSVEREPEPCEVFTHRGADRRRVLADARREDERVDFARDAIREIIQREARARVVAGEEVTDVAAHTGQAEETRARVQELCTSSAVMPRACSR